MEIFETINHYVLNVIGFIGSLVILLVILYAIFRVGLYLWRLAQILYKWKFRKKILVPYITTSPGILFALYYIEDVEWVWCNINDEKKPNFHGKYLFKYIHKKFSTLDMTSAEMRKYKDEQHKTA